MIPFATNYTGFSSYGQTRYPSLKPGNLTQDQNIIYEDTKRQMDHMKFYNNFKNLMSSYNQHFIDPIDPANYKKNQPKSLNCILSGNGEEKERSKSVNRLKGLMSQEIEEQPQKHRSNSIKDGISLLKNGVEHCKLGHSEYKTKFGRLGQLPTDIMNKNATKQINPDDQLKQGTTKCTKHIPGYTGYIPAAKTATLAYEHGKGLSSRTTIIKQNILENQLIRVPHYCGYVPKNTQNLRGNLRPKCFSTVGETFN